MVNLFDLVVSCKTKCRLRGLPGIRQSEWSAPAPSSGHPVLLLK